MKARSALTVFLFLLLSASAAAYPLITDVTRESQERCGLDVRVNAEPEGSLIRCTVLIPLTACPEQFVIQQAVLEMYDPSSDGDTPDHLLLVCPLANFTGCEMPGQTIEIRFKLKASTVKRSYVILRYGSDKPLTYRIRLESYVSSIE